MFLPEEAEDPACVPIFWVSKWVDYSDKYGLGRCPWGLPQEICPPFPFSWFLFTRALLHLI